MPLNIKIELSGIREARRELERLDERISNYAPFWRSVAIPLIKRQISETFDQEGPGWSPLSDSTLKSRLYPGLPILQQTGALRSSLVDNPIIRISQNQLTFGSNNPYIQYHEQGTVKMPARPILSPSVRSIMESIRRQYVTYLTSQLLGTR